MSYGGFPPFISAQLHYVINHYVHPIRVEQAWSGSYSNVLDRFTLLIPYCLETLKWDVIYNAEFPLAAPDVIFGPEDKDFHPFRSERGGGGGGGDLRSSNNCLADWNNKEPTRLLALIWELRDQYMFYQRKRVGEVDDDWLKFEISTMLSREGIEMRVSSGAEKPEEVKFVVPLTDMNINKMVAGHPWRHQQKLYLQVIYPVNRKYVSAPLAPRLKLMSTPELKSLFSVDEVKLPSRLDGMCMAEYLPRLEETLERQVSEAVSLIDVRRCFIEALAPLFGRPIETDSVFYRKSMFFVASGAFSFLYFYLQGTPVKSPLLTDYPWSPKWEPSQMAEQTFEFVVDEYVNFKSYCQEAPSSPESAHYWHCL